MKTGNPRDACAVCGSRGKRACPALSGSICPTCCATKRGSAFNCPASCPHFPFGIAAYDEFYKVCDRWSLKTAKYVVEHFGRDRINAEAQKISNTAAADITDEMVRDYALDQTFTRLLFYEPDENGRTLANRWAESGWTGLTNDEIVMGRYRETSCVTLTEIQTIVDRQTLECVDLLEPGGKPFLVLDKLLAANSTRFDRALVRLTIIRTTPNSAAPATGSLSTSTTIFGRNWTAVWPARGNESRTSASKNSCDGGFWNLLPCPPKSPETGPCAS